MVVRNNMGNGFDRREFMQGVLGAAAFGALGGCMKREPFKVGALNQIRLRFLRCKMDDPTCEFSYF